MKQALLLTVAGRPQWPHARQAGGGARLPSLVAAKFRSLIIVWGLERREENSHRIDTGRECTCETETHAV